MRAWEKLFVICTVIALFIFALPDLAVWLGGA
jgi:hypothetical protein